MSRWTVAALAILIGFCTIAHAADSPGPSNACDRTAATPDKTVADCQTHADTLAAMAMFAVAFRHPYTGLALYSAAARQGSPESAIYDTILGNAYVSIGYYTEALEPLNAAIALDPNMAPAHTFRGRALLNIGSFDGAIQDYTAAIAITGGDDPQDFLGRGSAYIEIGQYDRAIADFDQAIALKHDLADAWYQRGRTFALSRQYVRAIADLEDAVRLDPKNDELQAALQDTHALLSWSTEIPPPPAAQPDGSTVARAVGGTHDCARYYPPLSRSLYEMGQVLLSYDVQTDGSISNVILLKSSGAERLDRAAITCVKTRWRNTPGSKGGVATASPGHKAIVAFSMPPPSTPEDFFGRALAHASLGQYTDATKDFAQAIDTKPDYFNAFMARGLTYYVTNQLSDAIEDFGEAARLDPKSHEAEAALALSYGAVDDTLRRAAATHRAPK